MQTKRLGARAPEGPAQLSIRGRIAHPDKEIRQSKQQVRDPINASPTLKGERDLLVSIAGVAGPTAAAILSELLDVSLSDNARQVAAFAALTPKIRQSGCCVPGRTCLS